MEQAEIQTKVKAEIEALAGCEIADPTIKIFKSGVLDSLNILNIIVFIENEFGIKIDPFDISLDSLGSIESICSYIVAKGTSR
jgi:acyl carrier protein